MALGVWSSGKTGVSQLVHVRNLFDVRNDLNKVSLGLKPERANIEAREVHGTQLGRICPMQTPEQKKCGLIKYLALGAYISSESDSKKVEKVLKSPLLFRETITEIRDKFVFNIGNSGDYLIENIDYILNDKKHPEWIYF